MAARQLTAGGDAEGASPRKDGREVVPCGSPRRLVGHIFTLSLIFLHLGFSASVANEAVFFSQCRALLPAADEFAGQCASRSRPFSRAFFPSAGGRSELETYRVTFQKMNAPSHFVLGCVLGFKGEFVFLGIYYTPRALDMSGFESYPIIFVDPGGNVGLDVDGL
jgi:hypothetical protein